MKKIRITSFFIRRNLEAFIWIAALVALAVSNPASHHFSLCPLDNVGLDFCPGCGLGRSISCIFHGDFLESFGYHPLGIFAVIILSLRIFVIFRNSYNLYRMKSKFNQL